MKNGVVACVNPHAAEEGAKVLEAGGNAFDAALAAAFTQMIVLPFSCGLGGMVSANLFSATGRDHVIIDGYMRAGSLVSEQMWVKDHLGEADISGSSVFADHRSTMGYTSVCTPGALAGFAEIHERFATMPWSQLLQPAIRTAREGFVVSMDMATRMRERRNQGQEPDFATRIEATEACAKIFLKADGTPLDEGELLQNLDYADTLERVAAKGPREFYEGDLAREIVADIQSNGGFITESDMRSMRAKTYAPVKGRYREYEVFSDGPPGGGPLLIEVLNTLDGIGLASMEHSGVDYASALATTLQLVNEDRRSYLGDPEVIGEEPGEVLISRQRADTLRQLVRQGAVGSKPPPAEETDTTHLTVVDAAGNVASITHTLGNHSGVVTSGLGFVYNNGMNRFDPQPGRASSFAPGKARLHLMMPAIAFKDGIPAIAFGAPGGNTILGGMAQVFMNVVDYGMPAAEAVLTPRLYAEGSTVWAESGVRSDVLEALAAKGHDIVRYPSPFARRPLVQLVTIGADGQLDASSDPRGDFGLAWARDSVAS
jgi:gamma-glutamyltranspeptidase/glutathione hydrolase